MLPQGSLHGDLDSKLNPGCDRARQYFGAGCTLLIACLASAALLCQSQSALADIFHYNNILIGNRAMGMGGAYTALSEDTSGVAYNPAGIAHTKHDEISGSVNGVYFNEANYKKTLGDVDFVEKASGNFAPFLGGLYDLRKYLPGVAVGFGLYTIDTVVKNQDDLIIGGTLDNDRIVRFHRLAQETSTTTIAAVAVAKRFHHWSIGTSLGYLKVDELEQTYQDARMALAGDGGDFSNEYLTTRNTRTHLRAGGIDAILGVKYKYNRELAFGATYRHSFLLSESYSQDYEQTEAPVYADDQVRVDETNGGAQAIKRSVFRKHVDSPIGDWPDEFRLGVAYTPWSKLSWAFDLSHRLAAKGDEAQYDREAVTNYHTGLEYLITPRLPVKFGVFTNHDARPKVTSDGVTLGQRDHVDYTGGSLFFSYRTEESRYTIGTIYQVGKGQSQKLGTAAVQDVEASRYFITLAVTHTVRGDHKKS